MFKGSAMRIQVEIACQSNSNKKVNIFLQHLLYYNCLIEKYLPFVFLLCPYFNFSRPSNSKKIKPLKWLHGVQES